MSRLLRAMAILLALLGIALAAAAWWGWTRRVELAEGVLLDRIATLGVSPAALRVTRIDGTGIAIADLVVGAPAQPDLTIASTTAAWSLTGLREGRLDSLQVAGVAVRGSQRDGRLSFGALDALFEGDASPATAPVLPAPAITIEAAQLRVETPKGVATGTLGGSLQTAADATIDGSFKLALDGAGLRARGTLRIAGTLDAPTFESQLDADEGLPIAGRIDVRGQLGRAKGERVVDATVALRDVRYSSDLMRIEGANGVIALRGPPLRTPKKQTVSLAKVDLGLPLRDGLVEFTLRRDGSVAVALATLHIADGELRAQDVVLDLDAKETKVTLQARGLDLTELLANVDLPGFEGTGQVDGEIPLTLRASSLFVTGGLLHGAERGGTIRYTPSEETRALGASRPHDLGIALEAFSDFHYEILEARLDGELQGEMKIGLHVRGANPGFQDGRPVELNLNLEARLADLVRDAAGAYRVPDVIEQRLRAFSEGDKK